MTQSPWRGCWREGSAEEYVLLKNTTAATTTEISGYRKAEFKSFRKGEDCHDMVVIVQVVTLGGVDLLRSTCIFASSRVKSIGLVS